MLDVDVAVIGGGLVGASLAAAISSHPLSKSISVAVIDPRPPDTSEWPSLPPRTSTITPTSKQFLDDIGVWSHLPPSRVAPFDQMFVWDHPRPLPPLQQQGLRKTPAGTLLFNAADIGEEVLGFVLDNATLRNAMFRRMQDLFSSTGLRVIADAVHGIEFSSGSDAGGDDSPSFPIVSLGSGEKIRARLIAACDGARSRVRTFAGADWFSRGYDQSAVVANVLLKDETQTAYQRFVSTGPVAVLPVATDETNAPVGSIVWTTTPTEAAALSQCPDNDFIYELNEVLSGDEDSGGSGFAGMTGEASLRSAGDVAWSMVAHGLKAIPGYTTSAAVVPPPQATRLISARASFPLQLGHASRYVISEKRTVLVGDAAHAVHPLAGQGVNMGFADAESLAGCIATAAATGRDIGGEAGAPLAPYERERIVANIGTMGLLHGLVGVFGSRGRGLRRVGMSSINALAGIRNSVLKVMR